MTAFGFVMKVVRLSEGILRNEFLLLQAKKVLSLCILSHDFSASPTMNVYKKFCNLANIFFKPFEILMACHVLLVFFCGTLPLHVGFYVFLHHKSRKRTNSCRKSSKQRSFSQIQFGKQIMFHSMTHAFAILDDMDFFSSTVGRRNETANENYAFI